MNAPAREPFRYPWVWIVYVLLFAASIPWYLPGDDSPTLWLGLPYWVVISLGSTLAIALFTVFVIHRYWSDEEPQ